MISWREDSCQDCSRVGRKFTGVARGKLFVVHALLGAEALRVHGLPMLWRPRVQVHRITTYCLLADEEPITVARKD